MSIVLATFPIASYVLVMVFTTDAGRVEVDLCKEDNNVSRLVVFFGQIHVFSFSSKSLDKLTG